MNRNTLKASFGALAIAGLFSLSSCHPDPDPVVALTDYCGDVSVPTTWTNNREGVDYRVGCTFTISSDMVIEEGTEIEFKNGTGIIVGTGGSLMVKGTASNMVTLHGMSGGGSWLGLWFQSNSVNNELTYCTVTDGGQESFNGHDIKANVRLSLNGKLGITYTTIANSGRDGLYIEGLDDAHDNPIRIFNNNMFSNNDNYPISTVATTITKFDGTNSTYAGNGNSNIEVRGGTLFGTHTWLKNTIPFLVTGEVRAGYYDSVGNLVINAGVTMKFINDFGITVGEYSAGYLRMVGTAAEHITLMSGDANAWQGVCFQSTNSMNLLSYVDISKGGSLAFTGASTKKGNIVIGGFSAGDADIQNCTVNNSAAYGIFVAQGSSAPTLSGVTYSGNAQANYYVEP